MDFDGNILIWAFLGGVIPALLWLRFWIKEDFNHPEPFRLIFLTFLGGMMMVPFALLLEKIAHSYVTSTIILFTLWAAIEEILKFGAAYYVAFRKECIDKSKCLSDTMDPVIYLITAALGFAALENALSLLTPLASGDIWKSIVTGNLRFVGAMVLHVVASASVGVFMGFSFYRKPAFKKLYIAFGIFTAIILHALFNISIISESPHGLFLTFGAVWICVFILLALFERIKEIRK